MNEQPSKGLLAKPAVENIENCQEPGFRICRAALDLGFKPAARPQRFPLVKKCYCQVNLGIEIAVKAGLGATRLGQDRIDANLVDPVRGKKIIRRVKETFAGSGGGSSSRLSQAHFL